MLATINLCSGICWSEFPSDNGNERKLWPIQNGVFAPFSRQVDTSLRSSNSHAPCSLSAGAADLHALRQYSSTILLVTASAGAADLAALRHTLPPCCSCSSSRPRPTRSHNQRRKGVSIGILKLLTMVSCSGPAGEVWNRLDGTFFDYLLYSASCVPQT